MKEWKIYRISLISSVFLIPQMHAEKSRIHFHMVSSLYFFLCDMTDSVLLGFSSDTDIKAAILQTQDPWLQHLSQYNVMARRRKALTRENREIIESSGYFHGFLAGEDAEELLVKDGQFLVRETHINGEMEIVISTRSYPPNHEMNCFDDEDCSCSTTCKHFVVQVNFAGRFCLENCQTFTVVNDLIQRYWETQRTLRPPSEIHLLVPVGRYGWEFLDEQIQLQEEIGSGIFGKIHMGLLNDSGERVDVAVKLCQKEEDHAKFKFLTEARIMRKVDHPNICRIFGISVLWSPLKLILEFADKGDLLTFLRNGKVESGASNISISQKIYFAMLAAKGMRYLEKEGILHLDLGARNCLLKTDPLGVNETEEYELMISDFGMSRIGDKCRLEEGEVVAKRWAAPELLKHREATVKSDVWSFGVLLWEIFNNGDVPYPGLEEEEVEKYLEENRMDPPPTCPRPIRQVVKDCWKSKPAKRPNFVELNTVIKSCYSCRADFET